MTPLRILLITSRQPDAEGVSDSEFRNRIIHRYPNIANHEFECLGIHSEVRGENFSTQLETIYDNFLPQYIMIHTGIGLEDSPYIVIEAILNLSKKNPTIKVGFQGGKGAAISRVIGRNVIGLEYEVMARRKALTILETEAVFVETTEIREVVKEIFPSRFQHTT